MYPHPKIVLVVCLKTKKGQKHAKSSDSDHFIAFLHHFLSLLGRFTSLFSVLHPETSLLHHFWHHLGYKMMGYMGYISAIPSYKTVKHIFNN